MDAIKEIVIRISHPEIGLSKTLEFNPVSLKNWIDLFENGIGWLIIGYSDKKEMKQINFGEFIPSSHHPYLKIYEKNSPLKCILDFINSDKTTNKRIFLNYNSTIRLIKKLNIPDKILQKRLNIFFKELDAAKFWLNLKISDNKKIEALTKYNIGIVVEASDESLYADLI